MVVPLQTWPGWTGIYTTLVPSPSWVRPTRPNKWSKEEAPGGAWVWWWTTREQPSQNWLTRPPNMPRKRDWSAHKCRRPTKHKLQSFVLYNSHSRLGAAASELLSEKKKIPFASREEIEPPIGELAKPWRTSDRRDRPSWELVAGMK